MLNRYWQGTKVKLGGERVLCKDKASCGKDWRLEKGVFRKKKNLLCGWSLVCVSDLVQGRGMQRERKVRHESGGPRSQRFF